MILELLCLPVRVVVTCVVFTIVTFMQLFAENNEIPPPFLQLNAPAVNTINNAASSNGYPSISISSLTVSGIIVDSETQEPILRAKLSFYRASTGELLLTNVFTGSDGSFEALLSTGVNIERTPSTASDYWLGNVYPNPVSSTQRINLQYTTPGDLAEAPILEMYDVLGRRVYPSTVLASGVYFYRLRFNSGNLTSTRSFVLTRSGALSINLQQKLEEPADNYKSLPGIQSFEEEGIRILVEKKAYEIFEETRASGTLNESLMIDLVPAVRPSASFVFGENREAGQPVTLDASASTGPDGQELTYSWDFGDGRRGGQPRIARIYPDGGTYTVTLTVATEEGATHSVSQEITITETEPTGRTVTLVGLVRDASGQPLQDAEVRVSGTDISALTGTDGTIELESVPGEELVMIEVRRDGYALQRIPLKLSLEGEARYYFETALLARHDTVMIENIEFGVDIEGPAGARVVLGPESLVDREGNIVTGDVNMTITPIDMSDPNSHDAFPGGFTALEPDGSEVLIVSYGAAEFVFEQNGEPLQLAPGRTAVIDIPVFVSQHPNFEEISDGDVIPMWSLHPETGHWIEEGTGVIVPSESSPTGFVQRGVVTHFSWWNCDVAPNAPRPWTECVLRGNDTVTRRICQVMARARRPLPGLSKIANVNTSSDDPCSADPPDRPFGGPRYTTLPEEGMFLDFPPDYPLTLIAFADGGAIRGELDVCLSSGFDGVITIELLPDDNNLSELQLPADLENSFTDEPFQFHNYRLNLDAGTTVRLRAIQTFGGFTTGLALSDVHGNSLGESQSRFSSPAYIAYHAETDQQLIVTVSKIEDNIAGTYRLQADLIEELTLGVDVGEPMNWGDYRDFYLFAEEGQLYRTVAITNAVSTLLNTTAESLNPVIPSNRTGIIPESGMYIFRVSPNFWSGLAQGMLVPVRPLQPLDFAEGPVIIESEFDYPYEYRYFTLESETELGVHILLEKTGDTPLESASLQIYRPQIDSRYGITDELAGITVTEGLGGATRRDLVRNDIDVISFRLPVNNDGYILMMRADSPYDPGSFRLSVDVLESGPSFIVDAELACPGANTRSFHAALNAVETGGTVTVCDGVYTSPGKPVLDRPGITVTGTDRDNVVIRAAGNPWQYGLIGIKADDITLENFTMQGGPGQQSATLVTEHDGTYSNLTVRDMTLTSLDPENFTNNAMLFGSTGTNSPTGITGSLIENVEITGHESGITIVSGRGNRVVNNNLQVRNNGIMLHRSREADIIGNTIVINSTGNPNGISADGNLSGGTRILDNDIELNTGMFSIAATGIIIAEYGEDVERGSEVRRNTILISDAGDGIQAIAGPEHARMDIDQNFIRMSAATGGNGIRLFPISNIGTGPVFITNNVIDQHVRGIDINSAHNFSSNVFIFNNTFRTSSWNSTSVFNGVILSAAGASPEGALPFVIVNNIFQGRSGRTNPDRAISLPENTVLDADFNLFHQMTPYFGGITSTGLNDLVDTNPLFVPDEILLLLQASSPAIGAGAGTADYPERPAVDYSGKVRPAAASTIGAHEYKDP